MLLQDKPPVVLTPEDVSKGFGASNGMQDLGTAKQNLQHFFHILRCKMHSICTQALHVPDPIVYAGQHPQLVCQPRMLQQRLFKDEVVTFDEIAEDRCVCVRVCVRARLRVGGWVGARAHARGWFCTCQQANAACCRTRYTPEFGIRTHPVSSPRGDMWGHPCHRGECNIAHRENDGHLAICCMFPPAFLHGSRIAARFAIFAAPPPRYPFAFRRPPSRCGFPSYSPSP